MSRIEGHQSPQSGLYISEHNNKGPCRTDSSDFQLLLRPERPLEL